MNRRFGCWLDLPSPHVAEIVAQTGFDWVLIDLEHGPIGVETASLMLMALKSTPARGIVRIPELTEAWMKRALDMGAHGVMVPNIADAAQAPSGSTTAPAVAGVRRRASFAPRIGGATPQAIPAGSN